MQSVAEKCYNAHIMKVSRIDRERMVVAGTWDDFCAFRKERMEAGVKPNAAFEEAMARFCPKDVAAEGGGDSSEGGGGVDASAFVGKVFSAKDAPWIVAWVMDRMFVKDVAAEDAPNGVAWTLLKMCQRSSAFAEEFVSRVFVKMIPTKPPEEEKSGDDFDGKVEYDILGRLLDGEGR